jgi:predicted Rossmann fold nucleotide-binding protein DprA/Smf involved in DNA uptake
MKTLFTATLLSLLALHPAHAAEPAGAAMANQMTCGQMIASKAVIPQKLAAGASSVAEMMEAHAKLMSANKDKASQAEVKGLHELVKSQKQVATDLDKVMNEMKKASSWPAAPHDAAKMKSDPELKSATEKVIATHKEVIAELQKLVADLEKGMKQP